MNITLKFMLIMAVVLFYLILIYLLKNKTLELKYSLLWLFSGFIMALLIFIPNLLVGFVHLLGIESPMNGLFVLCIGFVIMLLMSLTAIVSRFKVKIRILIQEIGAMEKRIRDVEQELARDNYTSDGSYDSKG